MVKEILSENPCKFGGFCMPDKKKVCVKCKETMPKGKGYKKKKKKK